MTIVCSVFSAASSDDEVKDLLLVRRIRMLGWLLPQHLDITLNLHNPVVQTQISQGREGMATAMCSDIPIQPWAQHETLDNAFTSCKSCKCLW